MMFLEIYLIIGCIVGIISNIIEKYSETHWGAPHMDLPWYIRLFEIVVMLTLWPILVLGFLVCVIFDIDIDIEYFHDDDEDEDEENDEEEGEEQE